MRWWLQLTRFKTCSWFLSTPTACRSTAAPISRTLSVGGTLVTNHSGSALDSYLFLYSILWSSGLIKSHLFLEWCRRTRSRPPRHRRWTTQLCFRAPWFISVTHSWEHPDDRCTVTGPTNYWMPTSYWSAIYPCSQRSCPSNRGLMEHRWSGFAC